jgi:hypothetical protein
MARRFHFGGMMARAPDFSPAEIATIRTMAARGATGNEIALALGRAPSSVRAKCVGLGINLRPRKTQWDRHRVLLEPVVNKALVLAARKRGMRAGDLTRRVLTAVATHDLYDALLDVAHARPVKVGTIRAAQSEHREPAP